MGVLVAAAVGAPFSWANVEYRAPWAAGLSVESRTSLSLIVRGLEGRGVEPGVTVFALDTVAASNRLDRSGRPIPGTQCLPDPLEDLPEGPLGPREYGEFTGRTASCIGDWFRDNAGLEVEVSVVPGFGESVYTREDGSRAAARWELSQGLLEKGVDAMGYTATLMTLGLIAAMEEHLGGGPGEVHVDLTHGVNYATTAFYRASLLAARLYTVAHDARVDVTFYNSEPYVPGARRLNVWIVRREAVTPKVAASRLAYTSAAAAARTGKFSFTPSKLAVIASGAARGGLAGSVSASLAQGLGGLVEALNRPGRMAAASVIFGFPLLLLQAGVEALGSQLSSVGLKGVTYTLLSSVPYVNVGKSEDSVTVTHEVVLDAWQSRLLFALASFALYATKALESSSGAAGPRGLSVTVTPCGKRPVTTVSASLEVLRIAAEGYISGPLAPVIIENEISNFEAAAQGRRKADDYKVVREAVKKCHTTEGQNVRVEGGTVEGAINDRVFAAHAGLTVKTLTIEVECGGGDRWASRVRVRYNPCLLDRIRETAYRLLNKIAGALAPTPA